jgi:hypothetical protein
VFPASPRDSRLRVRNAAIACCERFGTRSAGRSLRAWLRLPKSRSARPTARWQTQPNVQQALRTGYDRQLERRLHAHSEALRTLDKYKSRLSAAAFAATQRLVEHIALDSYLVNVALAEDVNALNQRAGELSSVAAPKTPAPAPATAPATAPAPAVVAPEAPAAAPAPAATH